MQTPDEETENQLLDAVVHEACEDLGVEPTAPSPVAGVAMQDYLRERIRLFTVISKAASKFEMYKAFVSTTTIAGEQEPEQ